MRVNSMALVGVASALWAAAPSAHATVVTFAQYTEQKTNVSNLSFVTAKNGNSASLHSTTPGVGDSVFFSFLGLQGLPADLLTPQDARLRFSLGTGAVTTAAASLVNFGGSKFLVQPFNEAFSLGFFPHVRLYLQGP